MLDKQAIHNIKHNLLVENFNEEPVLYCTRCLSLRIRGMKNIEYCDQCGSVDVAITNIYDWEERYKKKYKKDFVEY